MVVEKVKRFLKVIEDKNPKLNAILHVFRDDAIKQAEAVEQKINEGNAGRLAGYVFTIKNNIAIKGKPLTAASKALEHYISPYDAAVIEKLRKEDAVIVGTANMDEFATGSDSTTSAFGPVKNAIDDAYVAGGSSGGSASSVKAGMADASLGSDTGGSIRCPATFNGVVGFKPSYGRVSRYGLADMAMSLDQIGPITNTVEDAKRIYDVINGKDERDVTTHEFPTMPNKSNVKVAVLKEIVDGSDELVRELFFKALDKASVEYELVSVPEAKDVVAIYYLNMFAEFSSAMQKYDGVRYGANNAMDEASNYFELAKVFRGEHFGREVKRRILLGTFITMKEFKDAWYMKALKARAQLKGRVAKVFDEYDILLTPTMPVFPWKIGEKQQDPVQMYTADIATAIANLTGIPAGTVPFYDGEKFPVGVQVLSAYGSDDAVLDYMARLESSF